MHQELLHKRGKRWSIVALFVFVVALPLIGQSCLRGNNTPPPSPVTLTIWRSEDERQDFAPIIESYQATYPHVSFEYRIIRDEDYERELLEAWSRGEGPDIFSMPNNATGKYQQFISPMPQNVTLSRAYETRSFGRPRVVVENITTNFVAPSQMQDRFPAVVAADAIINGQVYGLPLSLDTMVLYYNRDLFAKSGIAVPPATWEDFRQAVQGITVLDRDKNIVQSAVAMGTANNVPHVFDLLSVIMMQNGATMAAPNGQPAFYAETEDGRLPGVETVDFYTKFADDRFRTYTWNTDQVNGLEAFTQGSTAMMFGYFSDRETITQRAPNLNFSYTPLPQIDINNPTNYARYRLEAVHVNSDAKEHAWNFIHFAAMNQDQAGQFSTLTGRPPALLTLISQKQQDPEMGIFARQALTARSWYHGRDPRVAVQAFQDVITQVNDGSAASITEVLTTAAQQVRLTTQSR